MEENKRRNKWFDLEFSYGKTTGVTKGSGEAKDPSTVRFI
jgi:hypothetical protein